MKPRTAELGKLDRRMIAALTQSAGWPASPRLAPRSGWWWIADRLGDHLEDPR